MAWSYLWWDQPAKEVPEDHIVAERDDVLDLPEYWSGVPLDKIYIIFGNKVDN